MRLMARHQIVHDRGRAGEGADRDVNRAFGFQTTHQFVVVDDRLHIRAVDIGGQFCGVVGVHDHAGLAVCHVCDDFGCLKAPARRHECGFCVGRAEQFSARLCAGVVQKPVPDERGAQGISVGGLVAKNESCHDLYAFSDAICGLIRKARQSVTRQVVLAGLQCEQGKRSGPLCASEGLSDASGV